MFSEIRADYSEFESSEKLAATTAFGGDKFVVYKLRIRRLGKKI